MLDLLHNYAIIYYIVLWHHRVPPHAFCLLNFVLEQSLTTFVQPLLLGQKVAEAEPRGADTTQKFKKERQHVSRSRSVAH
jgi:hypothetical protein